MESDGEDEETPVKVCRVCGTTDAAQAGLLRQPVSHVTESEAIRAMLTTAAISADTIRSLACDLADTIDPDFGLLDQLLSLRVLLHREIADIRAGQTTYERNERLLSSMAKKSEEHRRKFLSALRLTSQQHICNYILHKGNVPETDDCRPLGEMALLTIDTNTTRLIELLDPNDFFLAELATARCINWRQREVIRETQLTVDKNQKLLDILRRRSVADFNKFIDCLGRSGQTHLIQLLSHGGVVVDADAELDESGIEDVDETEVKIESEFRVLLPDDSSEKKEQVGAMVQQLSDALKPLGYGVNLIALKRVSSIGCYIVCATLEGLQGLFEQYRGGGLLSILESIFTLLVRSENRVRIKRLVWNTDDYRRCTQHFVKLSDLQNEAKLHGQTKGKPGVEQPISSPVDSTAGQQETELIQDVEEDGFADAAAITSLPLEILEMLLIKAAVALFMHLVKMTSRADVDALTTVNSVCRDWQWIVTQRRWNKRQLRRSFNKLCHPYSRRPQLRATLTTHGSVLGVAQMNENIYVICFESDRVEVFNFIGSSSFQRQKSIRVKNLRVPQDIAVCRETRTVYIADSSSNNCIWQMTSPAYEVTKFTSHIERPRALSVTSRRLLVTSYDAKLRLFGPEGDEQLRQVSLPEDMYARHAVETKNETFVVCHTAREDWGKDVGRHRISEVDVYGDVIRDCKQPLNGPRHLALDVDGRVFVAQSNNGEVLLLNRQLQLERVLLTCVRDELNRPHRLCFDPETGHLLVGEVGSPGCVKVYRLRRPNYTL